MTEVSNQVLEARARRAASRVGFRAIKSRARANSIENCGGFQLIDVRLNSVVDGECFDMSAEEVVDRCQRQKDDQEWLDKTEAD